MRHGHESPPLGILLFFVSLFVSLFLASCKKEEPVAPPPAADLKSFFQTLPSWETFSPELVEGNVPTDTAQSDGTHIIDSVSCNCTVTHYSMATTPERLTTLNPDVEILWVGSMLQGSGYLGGIGSLAELPIRQRAPLQLSINLLADQTAKVVPNPTVATVNQAIGELVSAASAAGHKAGSSISYSSQTTYSVVQAMLQMGLSAKYAGATVKANLGSDLSSETRTVTAYFIQQMFTVSMVLPQQPGDLFSSAFTQDMLSQEEASGRMRADNPPVYVSSIVYGRILMFSFTSTSSEEKINATLNVLYNGGDFGGTMSSDLHSVLDNAQIKVVTVGGDADHALALIRGNNLAEYFSSDAPLTTARPISYTVRNLKDNSIAHVSETTTYDLRECVPVNLQATGARYQITLDRIQALNLFPLSITVHGLHYQFFIRDVSGTYPAASKTGAFNWAPLKEGMSHIFENTTTQEVSIHYDGRDAIQLPIGTLTDSYYPATYTFEIGQTRTPPYTYRWPTAKAPQDDAIHNPYITRTVNLLGDQFRIYWHIQRSGLLYD